MDSTATMETPIAALTVDTSLPLSQPSVCIPRVFANIGWKRIKSTFEEAGWGTVEHVDMVLKSNDKGEEYKKVFVHFVQWKDMGVREQLLKDEEVQLTYNDPWFWKVRRSAVARPSANGVSHVGGPSGSLVVWIWHRSLRCRHNRFRC